MIKATCNALSFSASFSHHWKLQRCGDIVRQRNHCLSNAQGKPNHHTWLTVECFCLFLNVKWWNDVRCSGCGQHLRGTCSTCLPWERSWPTMRMTQTPGWSAISLWITTMRRWASKSTQIYFGYFVDVRDSVMNDSHAAALLNSLLCRPRSHLAGVSAPKSTLPWSARPSSAHQREIKRSAETTSCVKSPTSPMVRVHLCLWLHFTLMIILSIFFVSHIVWLFWQ